MDLPDHFFRHETGRIIATLSKIFGLQNIDLVEDATQDACGRALEVWSVRGLPENPSGWLMTAAKNRAIDILRRERRSRTFSTEYGQLLNSEWTLSPLVDELMDLNAIKDDQLRLMFSCCHPRLPEEAQVAIMLHYLGGLSIKEIAQAYLSGFDTIDKRITRGKKVLAASGTLFDVSLHADFEERLPIIHQTLYLLFNQGYHGGSQDAPVQPLLCREAIRLVSILLDNPFGRTPQTYALAALMHLHAARLPSKLNSSGELTRLLDQDRSLWDQGHIQTGVRLLASASSGQELTEFHIEALIAALHASATSIATTDWSSIIDLYDALLRLNSSPVVALNRAIAVAQLEGPERGLEEIESIDNASRLHSYPFYWAAIGEFQALLQQTVEAKLSFEKAFSVARNTSEREHIRRRIDAQNQSVASQ
jgi:RNA polymerase sigma-70 factor (ECF subfamily)